MIPYNRQKIFKEDFNEVFKSLRNKLITTGPYVKKFENQIQKKIDVKYATVCSSGTAAITLAIYSLGVKRGDVFILPIINFVCASNILDKIGVKVYYADIDPSSGQMTPETLERCIKINKIKNIKAFFTMYLGGNVNNVEKFFRLKKKYKCYLIEDACHALGAKYKYKNKNHYIGNCKLSDICTFSLHPVKTITSGEGGIITTNNLIIKNKIDSLRSHGIVRSKYHWNYDIKLTGFNFRLSDINCALGYSQFKKLDKIVNLRRKIYKKYTLRLKDNKYITILNSDKNSSLHLLIAKIDFSKIKSNKNEFFKFFLRNGILLQQHYIPIYKFTAYKNKIPKKNFFGAKKYYSSSFSLPIYLGLKNNEIEFICKKIEQFISNKI